MPKPKDTLDRINVNTPCEANWDEMIGNDQVRFCQHCNLSVNNLSAMTRKDAIRLVARSGGRLCVRYHRRPDNTIETVKVAATQLHQLTRRASRLVAGTFTAALSLGTSAVAAMPASNFSPLNGTEVSTRSSVGSKTFTTSDSSLSGIVTDPNGAVLVGAMVVLKNKECTREWMTTTDAEGNFLFKFLEEGAYVLVVSAEGFPTKEIDNIDLKAGTEQLIDVKIQLPSFTSGLAVMTLPSEPLTDAVLREEVDDVKALLATGAAIDVVDKEYGSTALGLAVANGNLEIVRLLLAAGADPNIKAKLDRTSIMYLDDDSSPELVDLLVRAGVRLDLKDEDGMSVLMIMAESDKADVMQALINAGARVNVQDNEGRTPLMRAAYYEYPENVEVLLRAGADVNIRDKEGKTALGIAIEEDSEEEAEFLRAYGAVE